MNISRAIDRFLSQKAVERDWTPRTLDSVYRFLRQLADDYSDHALHDFNGRPGTDLLRDFLARRYATKSASTRATRISYLHSFFSWAEEEGYVDDDPSRRIKRPPKRKPDVYRPTEAELQAGRAATTLDERAPWLLAEGLGLRASTVASVRWQDLDLLNGRARVKVKGGHRLTLPIAPDILHELRQVYRALAPALDDHVFTVTEERWINQEHRVREVRDPKVASTPKAFWSMVRRVCARAGIRPLGPHALRHGFANRMRRQGLDLDALRTLMGHSRLDTTEGYLDELRLEDLERALQALPADGNTTSGKNMPLSRGFMEAAGIEPAFAPASHDPASVAEPEDPRKPPVTGPEGGHNV